MNVNFGTWKSDAAVKKKKKKWKWLWNWAMERGWKTYEEHDRKAWIAYRLFIEI